MLLQTALHSHVITQDLSAESGCVAATCTLLLRRASVLGERNRCRRDENGDRQKEFKHGGTCFSFGYEMWPNVDLWKGRLLTWKQVSWFPFDDFLRKTGRRRFRAAPDINIRPEKNHQSP
jgi:hypothetical protein